MRRSREWVQSVWHPTPSPNSLPVHIDGLDPKGPQGLDYPEILVRPGVAPSGVEPDPLAIPPGIQPGYPSCLISWTCDPLGAFWEGLGRQGV
jgi:hypothetical protein